jgi:dipeptidyl-peptidase-3
MTSATSARPYSLERVGPARVVQLYADGFERLTSREKIFCYYLSQAAIAGRDIALDQHHRDALEIRDLLEEIYRHPEDIAPVLHQQITGYLKLFWINNGFYDQLTSRKFVLPCRFEDFRDACLTAVRNGADLGAGDDALEAKLIRLRPVLFDPLIDPMLTNKTPGDDWIRGSAVNFYDKSIPGDDLFAWAAAGNERYPLNSSVIRINGAISELIWRAGGDGIPPGLYAADLRGVIHFLDQAIPFAASEQQAETIRLLIRFLRTGDPEDFRRYNIHWVRDSSDVDVILGFIEVYLDPRSMKGEWEASVLYTNPAETAMMQNIARQAGHFEKRSPWHDAYKKQTGASPIARVVDALLQTGGTGPVSPVGVNLPNEQALREEYGSKSVLLHNVSDATTIANGKALLREFAYDDAEVETDNRFGLQAEHLHTALHEIVGHGSGKVSDRLQGKDPAHYFPGYYNTLEEARADLVALWHVRDPILIDIGVARDAEELDGIARAMYQQAIRVSLTQLRRIGASERLEEDHMKNRQLIAQYIIKNCRAVEVVRRDRKTYYHIVDYDEARRIVGLLLADIMRIKAEGDLAAGKELVDRYGSQVDPLLRDEVLGRVRDLDVASYCGFVQPELLPEYDADGKITGVSVRYPLSLAEQMLSYSRFTQKVRKTFRVA